MRNIAKKALAWVPVPGLVTALLVIASGTAQAQTDILHACYMPATGVMYLIKRSGLPDECRSDDHVEIAFRTVATGDAPAAAAAPPPEGGEPPVGTGPQVVTALNTLSGDLTLTGSGGTTISDDGLGAIEINTFSGNHADLSNVLPDQHHTPYADVDAVAAMGTIVNTNALNHDRYADAEATAAMGAVANENPLHHDRYTDAEAIAAAGTSGWSLSGNGGTTPGTDFLGTTDNQPLEFRVNGLRALRLEPHATSPNVIAGFNGNSVLSGVFGATISGGGGSNALNEVLSNFGTVGGGQRNRVSADATIAGGSSNTAFGGFAFVGGGLSNIASGRASAVAGGQGNRATGSSATVGGGGSNIASGQLATIPGGADNLASGLVSFAAGRRAKAIHNGSFVWADDSQADFASTAPNQFLIRASGGVGIGTNSPNEALTVAGTVESTSGGFKFPDGTVQTTAGGSAGGDGHSLDAADGDPTDALFVDNDGNVGIGTTSPLAKLHVFGNAAVINGGLGIGTTSPQAALHVRGSAIIENTINGPLTGNGNLFLRTFNSGDLLLLGTQTTGNVGIGTVTPGSRLTVAGTVEATGGGFKFPDGTVQTTAATGGPSVLEREDVVLVQSTIDATGLGAVVVHSVLCPAGKIALGGGTTLNNVGNNVFLTGNAPHLSAGESDGWTGESVRVTVSFPWSMTVYAICV